MSKFKVGDIVTITNDCTGCKVGENYKIGYGYYHLGKSKELVAYDEKNMDRENVGGCSCQNNWSLAETINKTTTMKTLNTMMKKLLDKPTQTLVKADFINGDLELTEEGDAALMTLLFADKKDELVKMAEEKLKEEKD